jgi:hypothetical protein
MKLFDNFTSTTKLAPVALLALMAIARIIQVFLSLGREMRSPSRPKILSGAENFLKSH